MKKLSETYKELGITFTFPIRINNANGNETFYEDSDGFGYKREYNSKGKATYLERLDGFWCKNEYDTDGNMTYHENSNGIWYRSEYDAKGNQTYYENSDGLKCGTSRSQSCEGRVIEIDGKKYELKLK